MRRLAFAFLLCLLAVSAGARAGGGQSYSSGSSHSYSSGSSSYSYGGGSYSSSSGTATFDFLSWYIAWVILHPIFGVPFTLFILWIVFQCSQTSYVPSNGEGFVSARGLVASSKDAELARLRSRDPGFVESAFLARTSAAFLQVQAAWSEGDMAPARAFISDGVNERFARQLAALKARGLRNRMDHVEVLESEVLACRSDRCFDVLWVRLGARAADTTVNEAGTVVQGTPVVSEFEEVWTFLRKPGAVTLKKPGLVEGHCPSCGAPIETVDTGRCGSCKAFVNSGEYDWVLAEITQSCEWTLRDPARQVSGWLVAAAADPGLSLPLLEDRASVIFWRWAEARRTGDDASLLAVVSDAFRLRSAATSEPFDDAAVGAVETLAFDEEGGERRAHILVKWSGAGEHRRNVFILSRAKGALTDVRVGLRTARCSGCGAPADGSREAACSYCGVRLNDPRKDWILTDLKTADEWTPPQETAAPRAMGAVDWGGELSPVDAYATLALASLADGEESLAEKEFLRAYAQNRGIPAPMAARISAAAREGKLDAPRAADGAQAEALLRGMIRMSLADGVVTPQESAMMIAFGGRYGVPPAAVEVMVGEERDALGDSLRK